MLHYMIIFVTLFTTAIKIRAQCPRPVVGGNRVLVDDSNQQEFYDGDTVKFKCSTGYITASAGSRSITCTGTQWSELELECKKKSCGNPGEISNGKYNYQPEDAILFGATITAVCDEGYQLVGQATRNCRENGWDGRVPVCEVVKCSAPLHIKDGMFEPEKDSYNFGEAVFYTCSKSLDLIGPSAISCTGDGSFEPPPQCLLVTCERPEIRNAFRVRGNSGPYKYRNFVEYQCNKGYRMDGTGYLICMENGWDPPPPSCSVITCSKPPAIDKGEFKPQAELYQYHQTVTYSCDEGYGLHGASSVFCMDDGTFGMSFPQCLAITCDLSSIPHVDISEGSEPYIYGAPVKISCRDGYKIQGSGYVTCGKDGWNPPSSQCIEVSCVAPQIDYADIDDRKASYKDNTTIRYKCRKGYRMVGSDLLTCKKNGWNQPPPKCNIVTCLPPPVIRGGQLNHVKEEYNYKETITYSCITGYKLNGASSISCTEDGTFQAPPQCKKMTCKEPRIKHGFIAEGSSELYESKSKIRFQCNLGFQISGSDHLTCEEGGWDPPIPPLCSFSIWLVFVICIILFGFVIVICFCYKRYKAKQASKFLSNPEHCPLATMLSTPSALNDHRALTDTYARVCPADSQSHTEARIQ